jgi:hypothetical protein
LDSQQEQEQFFFSSESYLVDAEPKRSGREADLIFLPSAEVRNTFILPYDLKPWQIMKQGRMFIFTFISKFLRIRRILFSGIMKPSSSVVFFFSLPFYSHSFPWLFFHPPLVPTYLNGSLRSMSLLPLPAPNPSVPRANYYLH